MERPYIIGITGGSGSGKTTILSHIIEQFNDNEVTVICMDNYYREREEQEYDVNGVQNFDLFSSFDIEKFIADFNHLMSGETVSLMEYGYNNQKFVPKELTLKKTPVIILEGIFLMHIEAIRNKIDLKIFVEAKDAIKIIRRIKRDKTERNYPLEDVLYRYEAHVLPAFEVYIAPYKESADIIINNNAEHNAIIEVICQFITTKISKSIQFNETAS